MATKDTFDTALAALKASNPDRGELFKSLQEFTNLLGMEMQRMHSEQQQDIESFIAAKKADFDAHVAEAESARAVLKPKK